MYARVAAFEGGDVEQIRQMNQERREQPDWMPEGVKRVLVLNDEDGGKRLFIAFFESREALDAASRQFEQMGDQIPEEVRGRRTGLDVYEVVADEAV
jgi:hypothetical protein